VKSTGDDALFWQLCREANDQTVTDFLTFNTDNPNSIISSIAQARENARVVRDQITVEMWEEINRLHLFLRSPRARDVWKRSSYEFFHEVKLSSLYLQGLMEATVPHTEGWNFMQIGKYLERADKTTRILDVRHQNLPAKGVPKLVTPTDAVEWGAVLRSCSAADAYRQFHAEVEPRRVAEFLLLSEDFPRSVRFSLTAFDTALRRISGVPQRRFSNAAEKLSGRLLAEIQFSAIDDIFAEGFHDYLDLLQQKFNAIGDAVFAAYIFEPFAAPGGDLQQQQQQQ
ncbi:MAG TPA: alpha-E domain-containing protein, partial [Verrucomicrobiae bacterium]|nr:alpha-E domain-containing protein [Verrucomicrobiae bacterium]